MSSGVQRHSLSYPIDMNKKIVSSFV
jgi:hypothetical protein